MQENKNLVEEALIQMKNVEEAIAENAKGILASTMKEEINQLVKESLSEQEKVDLDADVEDDSEELDMTMSVDNVDDSLEDEEIEMGDEFEDTPIDLTGASDEELLRVFKAMGEEDGIIVKKDDDEITLKDNGADTEYLIKMGESKEKQQIMNEQMDEATIDDIMATLFEPSDEEEIEVSSEMEEENEEEQDEEVMYEIEFTEDEDEDEDSDDGADEAGEDGEVDESKEEEDESMMDEALEEEDESMMEEEEADESMVDEELEEELAEEWGSKKHEFKRQHGHKTGDVDGHYKDYEMEESDDLEEEQMEESVDESYNPKKASKPKGVGIGKGPKFSYKATKGGFKEDMKQGDPDMGTGKAKFEYKKGANMEGKSKIVKKAETKEAARTYGMGSKKGRGLRKGISNNRNLVFGKNGVKTESLEAEVSMLREKNEEYRKALNVFREKLNEVAIFNSNLAYATRLFTEHSTTKKEKINILRRFDSVETLKESKTLYKSIKEELSKGETKPITESVETKLNNTVTSGSAINLIESKTYENPQFLRMKDLMSKIR